MNSPPQRLSILEALMRFTMGVLRSRPHVLVWLLLLMLANGIAPLLFLARLEAQVVLATFLLSVVLMTWLTARYGFTRILGLGHVLWVPMVIFLTCAGECPRDGCVRHMGGHRGGDRRDFVDDRCARRDALHARG